MTDTLLLTTGTPYIVAILSPTDTRSFAYEVILSYTLVAVFSASSVMQSKREIPIVIQRTSKCWELTIPIVSNISLSLIILKSCASH